MAYVINDSCVSCGTCAGECPVNAYFSGRWTVRNRRLILALAAVLVLVSVRQAQSTRVDHKRKPIHKSRCSIRTAAF